MGVSGTPENDIEIISSDWIEQMLMLAQQPKVGAVGAMLYYPDDTIRTPGSSPGSAAMPDTVINMRSGGTAAICSGWRRCRFFGR